MIDPLQIWVLAILQGLTEFLPISSSAHLILVPQLLHWQDQGLAFDVALHVGSLMAILLYFRKDLYPLLSHWLASFAGQHSPESRLVWSVALGTVPVAVVGLLLAEEVATALRNPLVIASATIVFGLLLGYADLRGARTADEYSVGWRKTLIIGLAQAVAVIPGTSRSGITMTAGLMLGLTRTASARYSFLLSIPVILLADGHDAYTLLKQGGVNWSDLMLGAAISGISAYLCIEVFIRLLDRIGMLPFVIYRLLLGGFLFLFFW